MAWSSSRVTHGVCGSFRYEIYNLTDVKATRSLIKPMMSQVHFVATTNTTDGNDVFAGQTLNWTGTADSDDSNQLTDSSETFDKALTGLQVYNNTTTPFTSADTGTDDGAHTTALLLEESGQNFETTVSVGYLLYNSSDGTYDSIIAVNSNTELGLGSELMANGNTYVIYNTSSQNTLSAFAVYSDSDTLDIVAYKGAATDLVPDGNETWSIVSERVIQVIAGNADDDGTMLVIGK